MIILLSALLLGSRVAASVSDVCDTETIEDIGTIALCLHLNWTEVPKHMFENITYLNMGNNLITELEEFSFEDATNARQIELYSNNIKKIHEKAFYGLQNLDTLDLSNNMISVLPQNLFESNLNLQMVYLNNNPLSLPSDIFLESKSLTFLNIAFCNILEISPKAFSKLPNLSYLYLEGNNISVSSRNVFKTIERLTFLSLTGTTDCFNSSWSDMRNELQLLSVDVKFNICTDDNTIDNVVDPIEITDTVEPATEEKDCNSEICDDMQIQEIHKVEVIIYSHSTFDQVIYAGFLSSILALTMVVIYFTCKSKNEPIQNHGNQPENRPSQFHKLITLSKGYKPLENEDLLSVLSQLPKTNIVRTNPDVNSTPKV